MEQFSFPDIIDEPDSSVEIFGFCSYCNGKIKGKLKVKNKLMVKIIYWIENCPVYTLAPSVEKELKEKLKSNKKLKNRNHDLVAALTAVIVKIKQNQEIKMEALEKIEESLNIKEMVESKRNSKITYHALETEENLKGFKKFFKILSK